MCIRDSACAGGIGLVAVQYAQRLGAVVYTTADTEDVLELTLHARRAAAARRRTWPKLRGQSLSCVLGA
eukprot:8049111-Alexandrium_andersonii.AAC.1